jgi:hypothetical protein
MASNAAAVGRLPSRRWSDTIAFAVAAIAVSVAAAAWLSDSDQTALASAALPGAAENTSFEDRFFPKPVRASRIGSSDLLLDRSALAIDETQLRAAKSLLAQRLISLDSRASLVDEPKIDETKPSAMAGIPLPRSRPAAADLESPSGSALAQAQNPARPDDRTLLQKLSDLLPSRVTLASLVPNGGLFQQGPDLGSLGVDNLTAVYDISARAVYLPNGTKLEAHSGMGSLRDDPEHVYVPNAGATPPAVYDLKPREKLFHGVQALRMIPSEGSNISGRSGLLAHSFMLGPNGDSNGCVSIKDYDRFLKAYNDGEINRLVVVPSLSNMTSAVQRTT